MCRGQCRAAPLPVDQYDVKLQTLGLPIDYDAVEVIEGDAEPWEFVAAYGRSGRTVAVLVAVPGRVNAYREAIEKRAAFPPSRVPAEPTGLGP